MCHGAPASASFARFLALGWHFFSPLGEIFRLKTMLCGFVKEICRTLFYVPEGDRGRILRSSSFGGRKRRAAAGGLNSPTTIVEMVALD